jgi:hypothetical protein
MSQDTGLFSVRRPREVRFRKYIDPIRLLRMHSDMYAFRLYSANVRSDSWWHQL